MDLPQEDTPASFILDARHRCTERLASSPTATVYASTPLGRHDPCVAKRFKVQYHGDRGSFLRAFSQVSRLKHLNTANILDWGIDDTARPYVIMRRLTGRSMDRWLGHHGAMAPAHAVRLLQGPLDALAMLHRSGWVHGALRVSNLFISDTHGAPSATLLGVGANVLGSASVWCQPSNTPPELRGQRPKPTSDVYQMGLIVAEAIAGPSGFDSDPHAQRHAIHHSDLYPEPLRVVLKRATAPQPAHRYPNGGALLRALTSLDVSTPEMGRASSAQPRPSEDAPDALAAAPTQTTPVIHDIWVPHAATPKTTSPEDLLDTQTIPEPVLQALSNTSAQAHVDTLSPTPQAMADETTVDIPIKLSQQLAQALDPAPTPIAHTITGEITLELPSHFLKALQSETQPQPEAREVARPVHNAHNPDPRLVNAPTLNLSIERVDTSAHAEGLLDHTGQIDLEPFVSLPSPSHHTPAKPDAAPHTIDITPLTPTPPPVGAPHTTAQLTVIPHTTPNRTPKKRSKPSLDLERPLALLTVGLLMILTLMLTLELV